MNKVKQIVSQPQRTHVHLIPVAILLRQITYHQTLCPVSVNVNEVRKHTVSPKHYPCHHVLVRT